MYYDQYLSHSVYIYIYIYLIIYIQTWVPLKLKAPIPLYAGCRCVFSFWDETGVDRSSTQSTAGLGLLMWYSVYTINYFFISWFLNKDMGKLDDFSLTSQSLCSLNLVTSHKIQTWKLIFKFIILDFSRILFGFPNLQSCSSRPLPTTRPLQ